MAKQIQNITLYVDSKGLTGYTGKSFYSVESLKFYKKHLYGFVYFQNAVDIILCNIIWGTSSPSSSVAWKNEIQVK